MLEHKSWNTFQKTLCMLHSTLTCVCVSKSIHCKRTLIDVVEHQPPTICTACVLLIGYWEGIQIQIQILHHRDLDLGGGSDGKSEFTVRFWRDESFD
jgi:hypothetical protein